MQLYFIRHAQSENNHLWDRTNSSKGRSDDPALTRLGCKQAEVLAQFLQKGEPAAAAQRHDPQNIRGFGLTHLYCSLMVRSVATGSVVSKALGLPLVAWEELHEGGGIYLDDEQSGEKVGRPGKDRSYFQTHHPECVLPDYLGENGWWNRPFENPEQSQDRAQRFWRELLARHGQAEDRVAIISHGGFYNYLLAAILHLPMPETTGFWFLLNNSGITRIDFQDGETVLVYLNRVDFLPRELIT